MLFAERVSDALEDEEGAEEEMEGAEAEGPPPPEVWYKAVVVTIAGRFGAAPLCEGRDSWS